MFQKISIIKLLISEVSLEMERGRGALLVCTPCTWWAEAAPEGAAARLVPWTCPSPARVAAPRGWWMTVNTGIEIYLFAFNSNEISERICIEELRSMTSIKPQMHLNGCDHWCPGNTTSLFRWTNFTGKKVSKGKMKSLPFALNRTDGVQYQRAPPAAAPPARGAC